MGWARGTDVIQFIWNRFREYIPEEKRVQVLLDLMWEFGETTDWDTEDEIKNLWPESNKALEMYWAKWEKEHGL